MAGGFASKRGRRSVLPTSRSSQRSDRSVCPCEEEPKDPKDLGSANLIRTPRPFRLKDERDAPMSRQLTVET